MTGAAPAKARDAASPGVTGRNREFLPAAIEILETPPAPLPVALMLTICAFFTLAFAWSFIGRLDVNAVAPGKLEATGRVKVIQSLDPGKIAAIDVENGAARQGRRPAARARSGGSRSPTSAARATRSHAGLAEIARRRAGRRRRARGATRRRARTARQRALLEALAADPQGKIDWGEALPETVRLREEAVLAADLTQIADALRALDKQIAQKQATLQRLRMSIAFQTTLIDTLSQRVATRQEAIDLRVGTKINLYDAKEELQRSQSLLASDQGQLIETDAAVGELQSEKIKALSQFIADNENKAAEAAAQGRRSARRARQGERAAVAARSSMRRSTASCSSCR